jgi:hypothetical protein
MNSSQVALRLVGCPHEASNEYTKRASRSGSGLHVDILDPKSPLGFATIYICFVDKSSKHYCYLADGTFRPLKACDLLVFQRRDGGRAVRIETMKFGYVCIVYHHSSDHLHGSVFPNKGRPETLFTGVEGMKIVCYQDQFINKIARKCTEDHTVFQRYFEAHNGMRVRLQKEGPGKYSIACCHYAALARVLEEYCKLASNRKASDDTYDFISALKGITSETKYMFKWCSWCQDFVSWCFGSFNYLNE